MTIILILVFVLFIFFMGYYKFSSILDTVSFTFEHVDALHNYIVVLLVLLCSCTASVCLVVFQCWPLFIHVTHLNVNSKNKVKLSLSLIN
jgi:hypothetical protein